MVETPRCIAGLALFAVAVLGLLGITLLPAAGRDSANRYRQPRSQRRALKRGNILTSMIGEPTEMQECRAVDVTEIQRVGPSWSISLRTR
jgi:hypothetical protein